MNEVKIGFDKSTRLYIIPNRNYSIINGNREKPETIYFNNTNVFITSIKPTSYQTYTTRSVIDHYQNIQDNSIISSEEYNNKLKQLSSKGYYKDDNEDELYFEKIEDEILYNRLKREWVSVYKSFEIITDYEIIIINVPVSEYEDIQPLATLDDIKSCEKALFKYTPNPKKYLSEYCESLDMVYEGPKGEFKSFSWSNHSGIEYAKIDDDYLFLGTKPSFLSMTGSYLNCINRMNGHKELIKLAVDDFFLKRNPSKLDEITKGKLFKSILLIQSKLRDLNVYVKDNNIKNYLLKDISKLIDKLREE